jgi:hypothetical protein
MAASSPHRVTTPAVCRSSSAANICQSRHIRKVRANSAQEPTRGRSVGPPAEPAKQSSERHGGTPPAAHQAQRRQAACRVGFGDTSPLAAQCEALGRSCTNAPRPSRVRPADGSLSIPRSPTQRRQRKIAGHGQHLCPARAVVHSTPSHSPATRGRVERTTALHTLPAHARHGPDICAPPPSRAELPNAPAHGACRSLAPPQKVAASAAPRRIQEFGTLTPGNRCFPPCRTQDRGLPTKPEPLRTCLRRFDGGLPGGEANGEPIESEGCFVNELRLSIASNRWVWQPSLTTLA